MIGMLHMIGMQQPLLLKVRYYCLVRTFIYLFNRSPLHALVEAGIPDSQRFINTFRLFTSDIDLSDDISQKGEISPIYTMIESHCHSFRYSFPAKVTYPYTAWALAAASSNNMDIVYPGFWSEVIDDVVIFESLYLDELLNSILNIGPSIITGLNTSPCDKRSICHSYVQFEQFSETVLKTFISKGGSLHIISKDDSFSQPHTPTSLSLYNPESFHLWATFIKESVENLEQFLEDEISTGVMAEEGWDTNSLRILFNMDVNPFEEDSCQLCTKSITEDYSVEHINSFRHPCWEKKLAGIKWATNSERLEDEIRNLGWRAKYNFLCNNCWRLSQEEVEEALEDSRWSGGRIEELDSEDSSTESDAESEESSSDYDSPFLLSFG